MHINVFNLMSTLRIMAALNTRPNGVYVYKKINNSKHILHLPNLGIDLRNWSA